MCGELFMGFRTQEGIQEVTGVPKPGTAGTGHGQVKINGHQASVKQDE